MNCLHCGKPLTQMETDSGWHRRCSRSFFGTDDVPMVDVSGEALETVVTPNPAGQIRPGGWVALIRLTRERSCPERSVALEVTRCDLAWRRKSPLRSSKDPAGLLRRVPGRGSPRPRKRRVESPLEKARRCPVDADHDRRRLAVASDDNLVFRRGLFTQGFRLLEVRHRQIPYIRSFYALFFIITEEGLLTFDRTFLIS